jgi:hypothetical protein
MRRRLILLVPLVFPLMLAAQSVKDSSLMLHMFSFHLSGHLPAGDIAGRYGVNMGVGGSYWFKTKSNWLLSPDFSYFAGSKFKEDSIFRDLVDEYGYFITTFGEQGSVYFYERGFYAGLRAGKLLPVIGPNPNSGLLLTVSGGLLQYKTFIKQVNADIPILMEDYVKGYDYLTNGFSLNQFIGYLHLDSDRPINFYAGFEFHQAFTRCRRDYLFDRMGPENKARTDFLFGIRFGWIFPVNKKTSGTYYYY